MAKTTVAEIARRAGVSRLTVYNHFADLNELIPACSAHYMAQHPLPDFGRGLALEDPGERVGAVLGSLYAWYREAEPMFGKLFSDRATVPELDRFMGQNIDRMLGELADDLAAAFGARGRRLVGLTALIRVAVDFFTWRRLTDGDLGDQAAAEVMAAAVSPLGTRK